MVKKFLRNFLCRLLFETDYDYFIETCKRTLRQQKEITSNMDKLINANKELVSLVNDNCKITENVLNVLIETETLEKLENINIDNITN